MVETSCVFSFVYSMFDPGGVVTTTWNSELSDTGRKAPPTRPSAGSASAPTNDAMVSTTIAKR